MNADEMQDMECPLCFDAGAVCTVEGEPEDCPLCGSAPAPEEAGDGMVVTSLEAVPEGVL